jgi:sec-independent protein translocase protein TatB
VLDIGMPEFLVIAVVALVVLGPERLPEVMRRAGQFYRQARELMAQYTTEAQRMFEEGMREVEDVSATINSAWESATAVDANQPPPRLRQLPPPVQQPSSAADAGPWMLPSHQRDPATDREPRPAALAASPFALERRAPPEVVLNGYSGLSGPASVAPAPAEEHVPDLDALDAMGPPPAVPEIPAIPTIPDVSPLPDLTQTVEAAPARANGAAAAPSASDGRPTPSATPNGAASTAGAEEPADAVREQTVIELYLKGDVTWQKAAEFLRLSPEAFLDRVDQVRRAEKLPTP